MVRQTLAERPLNIVVAELSVDTRVDKSLVHFLCPTGRGLTTGCLWRLHRAVERLDRCLQAHVMGAITCRMAMGKYDVMETKSDYTQVYAEGGKHRPQV